MQIRLVGAVCLLCGCLGACGERYDSFSGVSHLSPYRAETEGYVRAIEAGMAHAERVQELRRSAARQDRRP